MAVIKSSLQNVRQQSVIKLITDGAGGTANVTLLELTKTDETFDAANAQVNIQTVIYTCSDATVSPIYIARGPNAFSTTNVMYLHGGSGSLELDQGAGFHDQTLNSSNLLITMPALSMLYLVLGKSQGYVEPNQQILPR
jgi:hypothetical protein